MSAATFSKAETENHRIARFVFVPWLVRLFSNGPVRGTGETLPVESPEALTDETIDAVKVILNRACWRFLARECGYRKLPAIKPGSESEFEVRRLWQQGTSIPPLKFTEETVTFLVRIYNATRNEGNLASVKIPDLVTANGDLIVHHLLFRRIKSTQIAFGLDSNHSFVQWMKSPLNAMYDPVTYRNSDSAKTLWNRITDSDVAPFVPWVGFQQVAFWMETDEGFGRNNLTSRLDWLEALTFVVSDLGLHIERNNRLDLAIFLLDLMALHLQRGEMMADAFEQETSEIPLRDKQEYASAWVDFLSFVSPLEESARKAIDIHPIERSSRQRCYLAYWESLNFTEVVAEIRNLSNRLQPSF